LPWLSAAPLCWEPLTVIALIMFLRDQIVQIPIVERLVNNWLKGTLKILFVAYLKHGSTIFLDGKPPFIAKFNVQMKSRFG
jgi:hypothetical protein